MAVSVLTPAVGLPVTLPALKQYLRIDHDNDDDLLTQLASAATAHVEAHIRHSLINRYLRQYVDDLSKNRSISIEAWPVRGITSVRGFDTEGNPTELEPAAYSIKREHDQVRLIISTLVSCEHFANGLEIDFISGYGEAGMDVPSNILQAINRVIAHWYEFRGAGVSELQQSLPTGIDALLAPLRRVRLS